jgi:hypothetical protein
VVAWGEDTDAEGNGAGQSDVPMNLSNVVAVSAGEYHSLAVKADGSLVCWGDNSQGQTQPPANLPKVLEVAGGGGHSLAIKADGTVAAWGNDLSGQCDIPAGVTNAVAIAAGGSFSLVLLGEAPAAPQPLQWLFTGKQFSLLLPTFGGRNYALEFKDSLGASQWTALPTLYGNGTVQFLVDPSAGSTQRFYRVRQWEN